VDSLSIFRKLLHSSELEGAKEDIRIDSVRTKNQANTNIARSFLRLTNLDNHVFDRLGRYETTLWRQTAQILLLLSSIEFRSKEGFQMSVHVLGGCGESMDGIHRLISIPMPVGGDRIFLVS
jgi:hypothetical protein